MSESLTSLKEIMTIRQLAVYLQMSPTTTYQLANKGELPGRKVGGMWRFRKREIDEWLAGNQRPFPLQILVIEDEKPLGEFFIRALTPRGHTVLAALSGEEALPLLRARTFDLVFLDLLLPGMSGIDVYHEISRLPHPPEVVVITSFASSHLLAKALEIGLLTVIQKPFQLETILGAVEKVAMQAVRALKFTRD